MYIYIYTYVYHDIHHVWPCDFLQSLTKHSWLKQVGSKKVVTKPPRLLTPERCAPRHPNVVNFKH